MKKRHFWKKQIGTIFKNRAVCGMIAAASVFLCVLTACEFAALKLELEVPVLKVLTGEEYSIWAEEYRAGELALDDSMENEQLKEGAALSTEQESIEPRVEEETEEGIAEGAEENAESEPGNDSSETQDLFAGQNDGERGQSEFSYYIRVNRKQNCVTIYTMDEDGAYTVPYKAMVCSTGLYNATPKGTYRLSDKYLWRELYGGVYGQYASRIHGGILFHSVPYYKKDKTTLGVNKYNKLGQQASMGCIRLTVEDAKWIAENCPSGTQVEIYDDDDPGPLGKPEAMKIDPNSPNSGWDPTDPDENNPWYTASEKETK